MYPSSQNRRRLAPLFSVIALLFLAGCGDNVASGASCTDSGTIDLVKRIVRESVEKKAAELEIDRASTSYPYNAFVGVSATSIEKSLSLVPLSVTGITVAHYDKDIGKYTCRGTLAATVPDLTLTTDAMRDGGIDYGITVGWLEFATRKAGLLLKSGRQGIRVVTGGHVETPVEFTTQTTVDTKQQLVELSGADDVSSLLLAIAKSTAYLTDPTQAPKSVPSPSIQSEAPVSDPPTPAKQTDVRGDSTRDTR